MTWINRVLMIPFIITLMLGVIDFGFFYYSALIALLIGPFQFFSFLLTTMYYRKVKKINRGYLVIYGCLVIVYFVYSYLLIGVYELFDRIDLIRIIIWTTPVFLSFFWTYILESIKKEL
ncbi:hypothetical protein DIS07_14535 [Polaribacter aquimarinus]|uniref:Uncharacterized protein n=2 Tax=Polaribacter aquimarinus TaxID=2100726 RepID=A0A2U2J780_9FLAO|nr:hypothetical protein DIS07_14535 [Polaribacter aquimarinus]